MGMDLPEKVTTSVWFLIWSVRVWEVGERLRWECHETLNVLTHWDVLGHYSFLPCPWKLLIETL